MLFEVANVTVEPWLPPLIGFVITFFTSMVGVSGAFLLLPFQISVLGYVAPSVSATNLVFNLVSIPGGVWQYTRQRQTDWRLAWLISAGTLPGVLIGWWLRVNWLQSPAAFKLFVGLVLLWIGLQLLHRRGTNHEAPIADEPVDRTPLTGSIVGVALVIGVIGGTYGIGGGSLMAPALIALFGMSVTKVASAALFGTLLTSIVGVMLYQFLPGPPGIATRPDWALGALFGLGGLVGMAAGARLQRFIPQRVLHLSLAAVLLLLGGAYLLNYVLNCVFRAIPDSPFA